MKISAVVLNWKDDTRTIRCIRALASSPSIEHIYVVDNESSGTLRPLLEGVSDARQASWSLVEVSENRGFAGGVNIALAESLNTTCEAVLVINNDAVIDEDSVQAMAAALSTRCDLGLVGPRILHPDGVEESAGGYLKPIVGMTSHQSRRMRAPDFITWACVLVRADALRDVGLLDEQFFMYWEDVDYSLRLKAAGWAFSICPEARAVHEVSANKKSYPTAIKAYHTWSSIRFAKKHRGLWRIGNTIWLTISSLSNAARFRSGALSGLSTGVGLAKEGSTPAYLSTLRRQRFGKKQQSSWSSDSKHVSTTQREN